MASMSPSLMVEIGANVAKLRTDMDRSINEISRLRRESDSHAKAMRATFEGSIAGISSAYVMFAAKATAALYTIQKAWKWAGEGAGIEETRGILDNLAGQYQTTAATMVKSMREASTGLISDAELMQTALGGLAKGMNPDQMIKLASVADMLGDTVNKSATEAFKDLSEALESGRVKALKGYAGAAIDLKEVFGDLTDKLTAADKAQAMYALIMIHGTKLQHAQTKEVDETADALTRFETRLKNSLDTLKGYVAKAAGLFAQIMEWSYKTDRRYKFVAGQDRPQPKAGPVEVDDPLAEYKQQLAELMKFYKARQAAENADKKAGKQAAKEAAEAIKAAEREKQEAIDLTTKAIAAEYDAIDQIIKDVNAGAQESLDSIIKQFEEVSRLYDDMTAKIEAANQQSIMGAFEGTGMGGDVGNLMSLISDQSVFDEAIQQIQDYYDARGNIASDAAVRDSAIEKLNWQKKSAIASSGFGMLSSLAQAFYVASDNRSKAAFRAYQAFAIAETIISTYSAAEKCYDWAAKWGGPAAGAAAAAIAIAAGMARVSAIASQKVGGSGGISAAAGGTGVGEVPEPVQDKPITTPEMTSRGQSINIYVEGNLVNHEAFAREILPALLKAQSDNVR